MKKYPDYKYKPRRKPKNPLPSNTPVNTGNLSLHNPTNSTSPMSLNSMMSNLQNGNTNSTAAALAAAVTNAVASSQDPNQSNSLTAQNFLNLGQNLNPFNLRDFPVLFPGINNAAVAALANQVQNSVTSSQANAISSNQQFNAFNNSLLNNSFLNPAIYSAAQQNQQILNTLNGQKKSKSNSNSLSPPTNGKISPNYPSSSSVSSSTSTSTLSNSSNFLQLSSSNNDAYFAALHQQFLLNQQQQFLMNNNSSQQQQQYSTDNTESLSNYFNNQTKQTNNSPLSIDNLVKKHQTNEKVGLNKSRSNDSDDSQTVEENSIDEDDGDYNEEISNLLEKQKKPNKEENIKSNGQVNYKRSIDSVLNERLINNNNITNNEDNKDHSNQQSAKHFKTSNGTANQFELNDLKLNNNLTTDNNLTNNLFNTLQRTYNDLSPTLMLENMKRFFSHLPATTSPVTSLTKPTENYLSKSLYQQQQNNLFSTNDHSNHQNTNNQDAALSFLSNLKPHLMDYSSTDGNFLAEFYNQLLFKQQTIGRSNSNDNFDLHKKSSLIL